MRARDVKVNTRLVNILKREQSHRAIVKKRAHRDVVAETSWRAGIELLKEVARHGIPPARQQNLQVVEQAVTQTQREFANKIQSLVSMHQPRLLRTRDLQVTSLDAACKRLVSLFESPGLESIVSQRAISATITYMTRTGRHQDRSRIFKALHDRDIPLSASIMNSQLSGTLPARFTGVLRSLQATGFQPDAQTIVTFIKLAADHSPHLARAVTNHFWRLGLLSDAHSIRAVASCLVSHDLVRWLSRDQGDLVSFLKHCDGNWQRSDWLSPTSVCRMAHVIARLGRFSSLHDLFDEAKRRGVKVDQWTLNNSLAPNIARGNVQAAIALTSVCLGSGARPDAETYRLLFDLVWKRRYVNLLRVVWSHACASGHVSGMMERKIKLAVCRGLSSSSNTEDQTDSRSTVFRAVGSKLAIDVLRRETSRIRILASQSKTTTERGTPISDFASPTETVAAVTNSSSPDPKCVGLLDIVENDLKLAGVYSPCRVFSQDLVDAYEMDRAWKERGLVDDLDAMLDEVCSVDMVLEPGPVRKIPS